MGFGSLRNLVRPLSGALRPLTNSTTTGCVTTAAAALRTFPSASSSSSNFLLPGKPHSRLIFRSIHLDSLSSLAPRPFDPLTDTRFPKRRPSEKSRRKRANLRPPGPYAWVKHVPGEPIAPSQPNKGSVKLRNEKKRRRQRRQFILAEAKKRKIQMQEANRKKREKRVERKMAAVARDREWAERLADLQRLEQEKKNSAA